MKHASPWPRRIVIIAAIIVGFWLIGLAIRIAGWILHLLLPVAAIILIIAVILNWRHRSANPKKNSLKISRDTSDKK